MNLNRDDPLDHISIELVAPEPDAFIRLRADCGWGTIDAQTAREALSRGLISVTCRAGPELAGFGRVVGDGVLYFYLQDIIVAPKFRGRALGKRIVGALMDEISRRAHDGATVGLMSAQGKEGFYGAFGFALRPNAAVGAGMTMVVRKPRGGA